MRTYLIVMYLLIMCMQCAQAQVKLPKAQGDVRITVQFSPVWEHTGALDNVPFK